MGKGDIKSKKGKRAAGSYGVSRKRKTEKTVVETKPKAKKAAKKPAAKKATESKAAAKPAAKKAPAAKAAAKK